MSYVLTLVSSHPDKPLSDRHIKDAVEIISEYDISQTCEPVWLSLDKAVDIGITEKPSAQLTAHFLDLFAKYEIDFFMTNADRRAKKLLVADMDSTIVSGETLDDLAEFAGIKDKVAAITQLAMEGKLDFRSALKERVGLLKGLSEEALTKTLVRIVINPGAKTLIKTMKKHGAKCVLVSGGFTYFTSAIGDRVGFDHNHGNELEIDRGKLTGKVFDPVLDKFAKVDFLKKYCTKLKIKEDDALTIGDGANDIPMLKAAGLGIGFHPKGTVKTQIDNLILYGDLTAALYAQGYSDQHFA